MSKEKNTNRRQEQRMPFSDLNLKVRRSGLSHTLNAYQNCRSVDLSHNGLAFSNDTLALNVPEKVDFILNMYGHEVKGHAVTCNKREMPEETLYGLMFLSLTEEISSIFSEEKLSTQDLEYLAKNQAESLVLSLMENKTRHEKLILTKQQQLFDACRCYLIRLGEMGVRMHEIQSGRLLHPSQAVKIFRDLDNTLLLRWHDLNTGKSTQLSIALNLEVLKSIFVINEEHHCSNMREVLEVLNQYLKQHLHFI